MKFPSLSELEPEQLKAIGEAKEKGSALFRSWDITYTIFSWERGFLISARNPKGDDVWYISTSSQGKHYAIEVPKIFRGKWIGTTLLRTKEAMNWILSHDWSARYSRILFLIKRGYIPTSKINEYSDLSRDIDIWESDLQLLIWKLQAYVQWKIDGDSTEDVSPIVFRLKYFPGKARKFVQKNNLW